MSNVGCKLLNLLTCLHVCVCESASVWLCLGMCMCLCVELFVNVRFGCMYVYVIWDTHLCRGGLSYALQA